MDSDDHQLHQGFPAPIIRPQDDIVAPESFLLVCRRCCVRVLLMLLLLLCIELWL
jgi:hypothetical protein